MAVLIIALELKATQKDYEPLFESIKQNSNGWQHYIGDVWIVNTSLSANDFAKTLLPLMDKRSDALYVARLRPEHQGWLPKDAWDWFKNVSY